MRGRPGRVLAFGLGLGLAADRLLWEGPIGPGFALWIALLGGAATYLAWKEDASRGRAVAGWSVVAAAAAAGTAWRGSPMLILCFFVAVVLAASAALIRARGARLGRTRVRDHMQGVALVPWQAGVGGLPLIMSIEPPRSHRRARVAAVGRGLVLALPFLVVFALLFMAADPWLERQGERILAGLDTLPAHLLLLLVFSWIASGLLAGLVRGEDERGDDVHAGFGGALGQLRLPRVGSTEAAVALGLVAALFTVFVASQFRYMFAGRAAIEAISGLTVAEYARSGFFELVVVAGLTLVLLLGVHAMALGQPETGAQREGDRDEDGDDARGRRRIRWLAGALIALTMIVVVSAGLRLALYVDAFGLTDDRVYAAAIMIWLTVTLLLFAATALRGRGRPFASIAFVACLATLFGLAAFNPDASVARLNLERASERPVDAAYLAQLGPDAAPVIVAGLHRLPPEARCRIVDAIRDRWGDDDEGDWRTWNAARSAARAAAAELPPCQEGGGTQPAR